jgi:RNA polymerase sigma factor (sigma-70 family)
MSHEEAVERFERLVSRYGHVIRTAIRSVAGPKAASLAADAEQQVLLELWRQVAREQSIEYPSSYLYKAAVRETIRLARQARERSEQPLEAVTAAEHRAEVDPERRAVSAELSRRLRETTETLLEDRRRAVIAHLAGYQVREIMDAYGWTYQRARNLVARGMADLRRALQEPE